MFQVKTAQKSWDFSDLLKTMKIQEGAVVDIELKEDLLVLACCLQRFHNDPNGKKLYSLTNTDLLGEITDSDRKKAEIVKNYYQKKLTFLTLQGGVLTRYRQDLHKFLYMSGHKYPEKFLGLAYKLPYFYDYDSDFDSLFDNYYADTKNQGVQKGLKKLTFKKILFNTQKKGLRKEYWFYDERGDNVLLDFDATDILLPLFDKQIASGTLELDGLFVVRKRDHKNFFEAKKYQFT